MESPAHITVVFLERYDDFMHQTGTRPAEYDEVGNMSDVNFLHFSHIVHHEQRRLYKTNRSASITSRDVDGRCFIRHLTDTSKIDDWVTHDDHYYLNQVITPEMTLVPLKKSDFNKCHVCYLERINALRRNEQLRARHQALRGLELFSGTYSGS
jgi:DNA (cytosine-5)-methyltransferase 1